MQLCVRYPKLRYPPKQCQMSHGFDNPLARRVGCRTERTENLRQWFQRAGLRYGSSTSITGTFRFGWVGWTIRLVNWPLQVHELVAGAEGLYPFGHFCFILRPRQLSFTLLAFGPAYVAIQGYPQLAILFALLALSSHTRPRPPTGVVVSWRQSRRETGVKLP